MLIKGPRKLVKRAEFSARLLHVECFTAYMRWTEQASNCQKYNNGCFILEIQKGLPKQDLITHVAHEMTHLRQFKHGELVDVSQLGKRLWKGELFDNSDEYDEKYFLSPWEMEARAMEGYITYMWENKR